MKNNISALRIIAKHFPVDNESRKYIRVDLSQLNPLVEKEGIEISDICAEFSHYDAEEIKQKLGDQITLANGTGIYMNHEALQKYCAMLKDLQENNLTELEGEFLIPISGDNVNHQGRYFPLKSFAGDFITTNNIIIKDSDKQIKEYGVKITSEEEGSIIIYDGLKL